MSTLLEKDRSRGAQQVINYLGVLGTTLLVSLDGDILLSSAKDEGESLIPIARSVAACARTLEASSPERIASLDSPDACTYFARVGAAEAIILFMEARVVPALAVERFLRVLAIFDRVVGPPASSPDGSGGPPDGAAAAVSIDAAKA